MHRIHDTRSARHDAQQRPPRHVRRMLNARADRVLKRINGLPLAMDRTAEPKTWVILANEIDEPAVVRRDEIAKALALVGLQMLGLDEILAEVAADPRDDGERWAVLLWIDDWVQCAWVTGRPLSKGGSA